LSLLQSSGQRLDTPFKITQTQEHDNLVTSSIISMTPLATIFGVSTPNVLYVDSSTPIEEEEAPLQISSLVKKREQ